MYSRKKTEPVCHDWCARQEEHDICMDIVQLSAIWKEETGWEEGAFGFMLEMEDA